MRRPIMLLEKNWGGFIFLVWHFMQIQHSNMHNNYNKKRYLAYFQSMPLCVMYTGGLQIPGASPMVTQRTLRMN